MTPTCRFDRSVGYVAHVIGRGRIFLVISTLTSIHGCAHETRERPQDAAPRAIHHVAPIPESSFAEAPIEAPTGRAVDHFDTTTIGRSSPSTSRFHGAPVDLDLRGADVHDVFRLLAEVGHVNIVVAGEVTGSITMRLRRVPWDQAMDVIARVHNLVYERDGNVILVRALR